MKRVSLTLVMLIFSMSIFAQMLLEFNTSLSGNRDVTLPLYGTVNVNVDWGDGVSQSFNTPGDKSHRYTADGIYKVSIYGTLTHFGKWDFGYANVEKLTKVISFGDIGLTSLDGAFFNAINLTQVPNQIPSTVSDIKRMFAGAISFNSNIGTWNVSNVSEMSGIFTGASSFNQDISEWDVSNVSNMYQMFNEATSFNQNLNSWNVSNVTNMNQMFRYATSFNQDLEAWDVSKVIYMDSMFNHATVFNGNIGTWNVFKVEGMSNMFAGATSFNQYIGGWNVFKVTDMTGVFAGATSFNQDIGGWDVKKVTDMSRMFYNASAFNQDISEWSINKVVAMVDMFYGVTLSTAFYNNMLTSWVSKNIQNNVIFNAGNSKYSIGDASNARQVLISTFQWNITDAGISNNIAISTEELSNISMTGATSGGNITDDAGSAITARGVVWNTTPNPTTTENLGLTNNGTGIGVYSSSITGLIPGATYYIRAYATNANGTDYGNSIKFPAQQQLSVSGSFTAINKIYNGSMLSSIGINNLFLTGVNGSHPNVNLTDIILTFADANVGNTKTVSVLSAKLTGTDAYKYSLSLSGSPTATANITPKQLTVANAIAENKVYDGNINANIKGATLVGVIAGDEVVLEQTTGTFDNKNVGVDKTVISALTINGSEANNYELTQPIGLLADITPATLTVNNASASDKIYDGNTNAIITGSVLVGILPGDEVAFDNETGTFDNKNVGSGKTVATTLAIGGADAINYMLTQPTGLTANITPRELTVNNAVASDKTYDRNTITTIIGANLLGVISDDDLSIDDSLGIFDNKNVGTNRPVTAAITLEGTDADNYDLIQPTGLSADIIPDTITIINAIASNKTYDGNTNAIINGGSLKGVYSGDFVYLNEKTGVFDDKNVGVGKLVTATMSIIGRDAANYYLTQLTGLTANITPKTLSASGLKVSSKVYDGTTDATVSGSNLLNIAVGDNVMIDTIIGNFIDKNVGLNKPVSAVVTITGTDATNYTLTQPPSLYANITTKTINVSNIIIADKIYDGNRNAEVSGTTLVDVIPEDSVFISEQTGTFNNKIAGIDKPVAVQISIAGTDAKNYRLTHPIGLSASINSKELTVINAVANNKVYNKSTYAQITGARLLNVLPGDMVNINNQKGTFDNQNVGTNKSVTAQITIGGTDALNYTVIQPVGLIADITPKGLTVGNASAQNKVYDGNTIATIVNARLIGLLQGDGVTFDNLAGHFDNKNIGIGKTVTTEFSITGNQAPNYTLVQPSGLKANIIAKPISVSNVIVSNKIYDASKNATITGTTLVDVIIGDSVFINEQIGIFNNKNVGTDKPVSVQIDINGSDADNYILIQPMGLKADIYPKELTVSDALAQNKAYDKTTRAVITGATLNGLFPAENVTIYKYEGVFDDYNVGIEKPVTTLLVINGSDANNYTLSQPTGLKADITPKELTVRNAIAANKIYDGNTKATILNATLAGVFSGDGVALENEIGYFDNKNVGTDKAVKAELSIVGEQAPNYFLTQPTRLNADITAATLSITGSFTVVDKVYDGTATATIDENNLTLEGAIASDDIELTNLVAEFAQTEVGENIMVKLTNATISGMDMFNYNLSLANSPVTAANITINVDVNDIISENLTVYPNPFIDYINLVSNEFISKVFISDITGNIVFEKNMNGEGNIHISNLRSGIYFLHTKFKNGKKQTIKLVKQ